MIWWLRYRCGRLWRFTDTVNDALPPLRAQAITCDDFVGLGDRQPARTPAKRAMRARNTPSPTAIGAKSTSPDEEDIEGVGQPQSLR